MVPTPQKNGFFGLKVTTTTVAYLLLVLAPLFWGGNIVAGKLAVGQVDPLFLVLARWTGAVLLLLPFALPAVRRDWPKIRPALPILAFYGMLGFGTFNVLMYQSAYFTKAINASLEQAAIPVFVLIGNFLVFRVRAYALQIAGLAITIAGVAIVASHGDLARLVALDVNIGDGMVIAACLAYAAYSLGLRYKPDIEWMSFIFTTALAALIISVVYEFVLGNPAELVTRIGQTTARGWICIGYVMLFPSIFAQLCYARGLQIVGANRASIFINLLPLFGALGSILIVGESPGFYHLIAAILVVTGVLLSEISARRDKPQNG